MNPTIQPAPVPATHVSVTFRVPEGIDDNELQCLSVMNQVMNHFLKPRERFDDAFAQVRVVNWLSARYGLPPAASRES